MALAPCRRRGNTLNAPILANPSRGLQTRAGPPGRSPNREPTRAVNDTFSDAIGQQHRAAIQSVRGKQPSSEVITVEIVHSGLRLWSLSALADELGMSWRTIRKRLVNVPPAGTLQGDNPGWHLKDALPAILADRVRAATGDPDLMAPHDKLAHYRAARERLRMMVEDGDLIPADEAREVFATAAKNMIQSLDTLPDVLERDYALDPETVQGMIKTIDGVRQDMTQALIDRFDHADQDALEHT